MECTYCHKKLYPDKKTAQTIRNYKLRNRHKLHGAKDLRIYPCPRSAGWHLTSQFNND